MDRLTTAELAELKAAWEKWYADDEVTDIDVNTNLWRLLVCNVPALIAAAERADAAEKRVEELKQGCIKLSFALSQIDYTIGEPNEMGVSTYDVFPYPEDVVERVKALVARTALGKEPRP